MSRPWKDYDDSLDYDELKKREQARLEYIQSKRAADEAEIASKTKKTTTVLSALALMIAIPLIVYAATRFAANRAFILDITPEAEGGFDFSGEVAARSIRLDDEISLSPTLTNSGSTPLYVFIRFDCSTDADSPIYSYTVDSERADNWKVVDTNNPRQICFAYVENGEMKVVEAGDEAVIPGTLRLALSSSQFSRMAIDNPEEFGVRVMGCGIDTTGNSSSPIDVYNEWIAEGGEDNVIE